MNMSTREASIFDVYLIYRHNEYDTGNRRATRYGLSKKAYIMNVNEISRLGAWYVLGFKYARKHPLTLVAGIEKRLGYMKSSILIDS